MEPVSIVVTASGLVIALTVLWKFAKNLYQWVKSLEAMHNEVLRNPEDREEMHTFMAEVREFQEFTLHELRTNSGSSIKDQVLAIRSQVDCMSVTLNEKVDTLSTDVTAIRDAVMDHIADPSAHTTPDSEPSA